MLDFLPQTESRDEPATLTGRAYAALRLALISGYLRPGERLTMRGVANGLKMSVTPVREAIQQLIIEHALVMPGPKTVMVPHLDAALYSEIILIRQALETLAAEKAAPFHTPAMIETLRAVNARHRAAIEAGNVSAVLTHNKEFHFLIYRASGLPSLVDLIEKQWVRVGPTLNLLYPRYMRSLSGNQFHERMIDALENGDTALLRSSLQSDMVSAERELLTVLSRSA